MISADKATNFCSSFGGGTVHLSHPITLWWYTLVMTIQSVLVILHHSLWKSEYRENTTTLTEYHITLMRLLLMHVLTQLFWRQHEFLTRVTLFSPKNTVWTWTPDITSWVFFFKFWQETYGKTSYMNEWGGILNSFCTWEYFWAVDLCKVLLTEQILCK